MSAEQFGPSALATPANLVTISRLLLTMPFLGMVVADGASWAAVSFWVALCITDGIDGHLARRQGTTRSGAFLDPLADKVLVLGAMFALVANDTFWWPAVAIITVREIGIMGLRSYWGRKGLAVPASPMAKAKTVVQEVAVGFALLPHHRRGLHVGGQHGHGGGRRPHGRVGHPVRGRRLPRRHHAGLARLLTVAWLTAAADRSGRMPGMRCEIVAVGTELLLGQIVDTNSSWMGEQLAIIGVEHQRQTKVGDNLGRIVDAITEALGRADAVIVCGGLGPTQDDITREAHRPGDGRGARARRRGRRR